MPDRRSEGTTFRDPVSYGRFNQDGGFLDTIATVPGFERYIREFQGRASTGRRPFGYWIFGTAGAGHFYYGAGERFEISAYSLEGEVQKLIRRVETDRTVRPEDIEAYKGELLQQASDDPNVRREWQRLVDEAPYPSSFPSFDRILVDREGNLWVQEYERPMDETLSWSVFDPTGRWVSDITVPRELRILEVGADYVMGLFLDELGVECVQLYDLFKPRI